jgi:hypothetical protein
MVETENKKRKAAAIAAVMAYLTYEQEAGVLGTPPDEAAVPAAPMRLWGISGRQDQMHHRTLMQLRAFK